MAKKNKNLKAVIKDASGDIVTEVEKGLYVTIPVDPQTKENLIRLCIAKGGSKRSQGAMVRMLVNDAMAKQKMEDQLAELKR